MAFEQFTYPPCESPLLDAYNRAFESVFILLHPFIRVPDELAWRFTKHYPTDGQILAHGAKCTWAEVASQTGIATCARLNQALLTAAGSLAGYLCDYPARDALQSFLQSESVWMPGQGAFEPQLQSDILSAFAHAGYTDLIFVPEFPRADPIERLRINDLQQRRQPFPGHGSLVAPDASFLFTVDWDSFFTLFYGPREFVDHIARTRNLEGFFASPLTEHAWFNYTMGCATVTLSPEHWPA